MKKENQHQCLRLGVIERGKLVEERVFKKGEEITLGRSSQNTWVIEDEQFPAKHRLFQWKDGSYTLHLPNPSRAKISSSEGIQELGTSSIENSVGTPESEAFVLCTEMRGKIQIGKTTLLFQFVPAPVEAKEAPLPVQLRGWRLKSDWIYASAMLLSLVGHSGAITYISLHGPSPAELSESSRFQPKHTEAPVLLVVPPAPTKPSIPSIVPNKPTPRPTNRPRPSNTKPHPSRNIQDKKTQQDKISKHVSEFVSGNNSSVHQMLAPQQGDPFLRRFDQLKQTTASQDHGRLLGTRGEGVKTDIETNRHNGLPYTVPSGPSAPKNANSGRTAAEIKCPRFTVEPIPSVPIQINEASLQRFLQRRKKAIVHCYEKDLRHDPDQKGRIEIRLTLKTNGTIHTEIERNELSKSTAACIQKTLSRQRMLPSPKEEVEVVVPFLFEPQR
ncbi:AgmX/PglI C-terminal domain-containing protein [Myxococcota bacterium]|nr:AgmX/PglI C-terminal domain-containing protein [Myxococcota bacterium]